MSTRTEQGMAHGEADEFPGVDDLIESTSVSEGFDRPVKPAWWAWLLVAVGLSLIVELGVKVWNLYAAIHAYEVRSGVILDHDLPSLVALASDLPFYPTMNTVGEDIAPAAEPDPTPNSDQNLVGLDVAPPFSLPRHHDLALGILGLLLVGIGSPRLVRREPRWATGTIGPADRRSTRPLPSAIGRAAITTVGLGGRLLTWAAELFLATVFYLTLLSLIDGASVSWTTVDRTIDQVIGSVAAWLVAYL